MPATPAADGSFLHLSRVAVPGEFDQPALIGIWVAVPVAERFAAINVQQRACDGAIACDGNNSGREIVELTIMMGELTYGPNTEAARRDNIHTNGGQFDSRCASESLYGAMKGAIDSHPAWGRRPLAPEISVTVPPERR